jgi:hypothetical protein
MEERGGIMRRSRGTEGGAKARWRGEMRMNAFGVLHRDEKSK